jgi:hypothetical protein
MFLGVFESLAEVSWRRWRIFQLLLHRLRLRPLNKLGVGLRRLSRGQAFGGMLGSTKRFFYELKK